MLTSKGGAERTVLVEFRDVAKGDKGGGYFGSFLETDLQCENALGQGEQKKSSKEDAS